MRTAKLDRHRIRAAAVAAVFFSLLAGCASRSDLQPAPDARMSDTLPSAAISKVGGIEVVAQSEAWTGRPDVTQEITPVRIEIRNDGEHLLRIRYSDFALTNDKGVRYSSIPPYGIQGTVEEPMLVREYSPVRQPRFRHRGFRVANYLSPAYPTMTASSDPFYYEPQYHSTYYRYWEYVDLPTPHMLDVGLPEGVVEPGGMVSGFLYFEHVDPGDDRVLFTADLVDARTGKRLGTASIPFLVKSVASY